MKIIVTKKKPVNNDTFIMDPIDGFQEDCRPPPSQIKLSMPKPRKSNLHALAEWQKLAMIAYNQIRCRTAEEIEFAQLQKRMNELMAKMGKTGKVNIGNDDVCNDDNLDMNNLYNLVMHNNK